MKKGDISPYNSSNSSVLVIDADLFVKIKWTFRWWFYREVVYSDYANALINFLRNRGNEFDSIIVAHVGVTNRIIVEEAIFGKLGLTTGYMCFSNEFEYEKWLKIIKPSNHFAIFDRRTFCNSSEFITHQKLGEKNEQSRSH